MLAGCLALLVLAIGGQLVAFGVVYGVLLVAPRTVLARFRTRWGCLPARHARIVHDALALRAMATALAHYRAVRSIALADELRPRATAACADDARAAIDRLTAGEPWGLPG